MSYYADLIIQNAEDEIEGISSPSEKVDILQDVIDKLEEMKNGIREENDL